MIPSFSINGNKIKFLKQGEFTLLENLKILNELNPNYVVGFNSMRTDDKPYKCYLNLYKCYDLEPSKELSTFPTLTEILKDILPQLEKKGFSLNSNIPDFDVNCDLIHFHNSVSVGARTFQDLIDLSNSGNKYKVLGSYTFPYFYKYPQFNPVSLFRIFITHPETWNQEHDEFTMHPPRILKKLMHCSEFKKQRLEAILDFFKAERPEMYEAFMRFLQIKGITVARLSNWCQVPEELPEKEIHPLQVYTYLYDLKEKKLKKKEREEEEKRKSMGTVSLMDNSLEEDFFERASEIALNLMKSQTEMPIFQDFSGSPKKFDSNEKSRDISLEVKKELVEDYENSKALKTYQLNKEDSDSPFVSSNDEYGKDSSEEENELLMQALADERRERSPEADEDDETENEIEILKDEPFSRHDSETSEEYDQMRGTRKLLIESADDDKPRDLTQELFFELIQKEKEEIEAMKVMSSKIRLYTEEEKNDPSFDPDKGLDDEILSLPEGQNKGVNPIVLPDPEKISKQAEVLEQYEKLLTLQRDPDPQTDDENIILPIHKLALNSFKRGLKNMKDLTPATIESVTRVLEDLEEPLDNYVRSMKLNDRAVKPRRIFSSPSYKNRAKKTDSWIQDKQAKFEGTSDSDSWTKDKEIRNRNLERAKRKELKFTKKDQMSTARQLNIRRGDLITSASEDSYDIILAHRLSVQPSFKPFPNMCYAEALNSILSPLGITCLDFFKNGQQQEFFEYWLKLVDHYQLQEFCFLISTTKTCMKCGRKKFSNEYFCYMRKFQTKYSSTRLSKCDFCQEVVRELTENTYFFSEYCLWVDEENAQNQIAFGKMEPSDLRSIAKGGIVGGISYSGDGAEGHFFNSKRPNFALVTRVKGSLRTEFFEHFRSGKSIEDIAKENNIMLPYETFL